MTKQRLAEIMKWRKPEIDKYLSRFILPGTNCHPQDREALLGEVYELVCAMDAALTELETLKNKIASTVT